MNILFNRNPISNPNYDSEISHAFSACMTFLGVVIANICAQVWFGENTFSQSEREEAGREGGGIGITAKR